LNGDCMKITEITPHYLLDMNDEGVLPWSSGLLLVSVTTSDGTTGYGEAITTFRAATVYEAIKRTAKFYIGRELDAPQLLLSEIKKQDYYYFQSFESASAASSIDIALWDIMGKQFGAPVSALIGGTRRKEVELYANGWYSGCISPEQYAERARDVIRRGYSAIKLDPFGDAFDTITDEQLASSVAVLEAIRNAVGDRVKILVEHHGRFSLRAAVNVARAIAHIAPYFVEEPVHQSSLELLRRYREATRGLVSVAVGERICSLDESIDFLSNHLVDFIQPDVCNIGGISEAIEVCRIAEANGVVPTLHNAHGPVQNAATLQVDAAMDNFTIQESFYEFMSGWKRKLIQGAMRIEHGRMVIPSGPGLGININERLLDELKVPCEDKIPDAPIIWAVRGTVPVRNAKH